MESNLPVLDGRSADAILKELLDRRPAYVPELLPARGLPALALLQIFSDYMKLTADRLNQAPAKNLLAFLDMMGINLNPAQPARAVVTFLPRDTAPNGRLPAGTKLLAAGASTPLPFETETGIAVAAAKLVEVVSLWPAQDVYVDHTTALNGGRQFRLFQGGTPVRHELYLSHPIVLAFAAKTIVEVEFELPVAGSASLNWIWESWDGQAWRSFHEFDVLDSNASQDGTVGLTRSGVVRLRAECGDSAPTTVGGINSYWIRARLDQSLSPDPAAVLASADRIRLRTTIDHSLQDVGGFPPDQAFSGPNQLDLSGTFFPFGKAPDGQSIFYVSSAEAFGKPGAQVTLFFDRVETPEQEGDTKGTNYQIDVNNAKNILKQAAVDAAQTVSQAAKDFLNLLPTWPNTADTNKINQTLTTLGNVIGATTGMNDIGPLADAAKAVAQSLSATLQGVFGTVPSAVAENIASLGLKAAEDAANAAVAVLSDLSQLSPLQAAAAGGQLPPTVNPAELIWEYWNGSAWSVLIQPANTPSVNLLGLGVGRFSFTVPSDLQATAVNSVNGFWIRARIFSGSYNNLRLVSWFDSITKTINFFPILEPRPPALTNLLIGYTYRSNWEFPDQCLTFNDFQFELHSADVRSPGNPFPPFHPVSDALPALYLGFDRPLPNDLVSLYFDLQEIHDAGLPLAWEAWDGAQWQLLEVSDDTAGLIAPGMVSFIPPDLPAATQVAIAGAAGNAITPSDPAQAAVFRDGEQVIVAQDTTQELATIAQVDGGALLVEMPLANTYTSGTVSKALLPRFGNARAWVRARLKQDGAPLQTVVNYILVNAVWAAQVQTIKNEVLGSGNGQPGEAVFMSQTPVLPLELIEVRELSGVRAHVELPILRKALLSNGFTDEMIRTVTDPRTGEVQEVWVRWQERPNLFFSGPDDRHYVVERARGRIIFGDGQHGRLPEVGANNIQAASYRSTRGSAGNVAAGKITQLLGGATFVKSVTNPLPADGGVDNESLQNVAPRGEQVFRHQDRALAARDYEALAKQSSPGVAIAKALPALTPDLLPAPGWVTVIIAPRSTDPEPQPSYDLRRQVHDFLAARMPATVAGAHLEIVGPKYLRVGVRASVAARVVAESGAVKDEVVSALAAFLHPLTGGPDGQGWAFGRDVFLSDAVTALKGVWGIDFVSGFELLVDGIPSGDSVIVSPDRLVAAGLVQIEMLDNLEVICPCR